MPRREEAEALEEQEERAAGLEQAGRAAAGLWVGAQAIWAPGIPSLEPHPELQDRILGPLPDQGWDQMPASE